MQAWNVTEQDIRESAAAVGLEVMNDWNDNGITADGGYVIVDVSYLEDVTESWIFHGDIPAGLVLTEDDEGEDCDYTEFGVVRHRKWSGPMTHEDIKKLRSDWDLEHERSEPNMGMLTEFGYLPGDRFMFDGMDWNVGGVTPIFDVSVSIFDAVALQPV